MIRFSWSLLTAVSMLLLASGATSQAGQDGREDGAGQEFFVLEQGYHGTRPGRGNRLPRVEELKGRAGGWVTWPGFQMREDGGSRLFLQTTRPLVYMRTAGKQRFTLHFENARVHLSNNRNPLITEFFNTPVRSAGLKRRGKHVDLVVELKTAAAETVVQYRDDDGYHYLIIDFPPGDYPRRAAPTPRLVTAKSGSWTSFGAWGASSGSDQYTPIGDRPEVERPAPAEPAEADAGGEFIFNYGFGFPFDPDLEVED